MCEEHADMLCISDIVEGLQAKLLCTFVYQKYPRHTMGGGEPNSNLGQII
jgi:hypothetical protein